MPHNTFCHIEFDSTDLARSQRFFEGLFGWTFRAFGEKMVVFGLGDQHLGGLQKADNVAPGRSPSVWIEVASLDPMVTKAVGSGGSLERGREEVPGVGWSAVVKDPDGNFVGLVEFSRQEG
ncbi:MAG: VOC family protein [Fimbriimonas ginsengisoli]|uniref:VOC family protein n=1 Tax=Fimbriimonas ginsengisoli TaxID=1005039 RepID=A0A931PV79_FIMGI|nr:VOC family protein [Fimbriimonas ginsengisoli]MBI3722260.1 VOC family protein [Fimbriimonas ginsengisoli]